jgi:hypothetical protein
MGVSMYYPKSLTEFEEERLILEPESKTLIKSSRFINIYDSDITGKNEAEFVLFS